MIVTIDGPAGAGKSTVARRVAAARGMTYLDTGAMYRAVTLRALREGVDLGDADALARIARRASIGLSGGPDGVAVTLDGQDVTKEVRAREVDDAVSAVSAVPGVRAAMVDAQRGLAAAGDVVAEGRDMGTVVFPDAEVKVFLTATAEARAHRRAAERGEAGTVAEAETLRAIQARDEADSTRDVAPLAAAADAHVIDSSELSVDEVVGVVAALVEALGGPGPAGVAEAPQEPSASQGDGPSEPSRPDRPAPDAPCARRVGGREPAGREEGRRPGRFADGPARLRSFRGNAFDDYYECGMRDFPPPARAFLWLAINVVWLVSKVVYPWRIEAAERLWLDREADGTGRVVVMNHISMVDPVLVVIALYHHGIRTRPISKSEFTKSRLVEWALCRFGCIPVVRGTADVKAVRRAQRALQRGEYVLVFPEGTRIRSDEQAIEIHGGFALMAHMARARVQPTAIVGARRNPSQVVPHPHRVFIKAGVPISFEEVAGTRRKERIAEMERIAVERMYELRDELRREHPGRS